MASMGYTRSMNTNGAGNGVACRLVVDGRVIEFTLPGRLVELAPGARTAHAVSHEQTAKRTTRRRGSK
jgi:hypothetical protein